MPASLSRRRGLGGTVLLAALLLTVGSGCRSRRPPLAKLVFGGEGPPTLVLLHGYGSSAERWAPFTQTIALPPGARFVFPQGPEVTVPPDGPADGRAWWRLELAAHIPPGKRIPDYSRARPEGLGPAALRVRDLLAELRRKPGGPIALGGFSQGAMVAGEIAFRSVEPMTALVLLSGTSVDEAGWERGFAARRGLPVFISHGRADDILPFEVADRLQGKLKQAGLAVTWFPFASGHEIPADVVVALNAFLASLPLKP